MLKDPAQLHLPGYANGKPEGYLFPATYKVQPHETALGVLAGMVQRFNQEAATVNLPAAAKQVAPDRGAGRGHGQPGAGRRRPGSPTTRRSPG